MREVDGKSLPTIWSDLFLEFDQVEGKIDTEETLSIKGIIDWIEKYAGTPDNSSSDTFDALLREGSTWQDYLTGIISRVQHMYDYAEMDFDTWKASTMAGYTSTTGKELSEAARERMVMCEEMYQMKQTVLIHINSMVSWSLGTMKALNVKLERIQTKLKGRQFEQPKLP